MRKLLAITVLTAVILAWWYAHDLISVARGQVEPASCTTPEGRADLNDDGSTDIADTIFLLHWLFVGGSAPRACAAPPVVNEFAENIAGTFFVCGRNGEGAVTSRSLATIHSDGTGHTANSYQFLSNELSRYTSVMKGSWKQIGDHTSLHVILQFYFDAQGEITYIMRMRATATWASDFNSYSGPWTAELFRPGAIQCDPAWGPRLDFNNPEIVADGTFRAIRVPVN